MSRSIVTIANEFSGTDNCGLVLIGTDRNVQVIEFNVRTGDDEEGVLIANTFPEPFSQAVCETLIESLCLPKAEKAVGFVVADGEGWAHIKTEGRECNDFSLAAAAAVYKVSFGWDESRSIVIKVNDAELNLLPRFDGNHWVVTSLP